MLMLPPPLDDDELEEEVIFMSIAEWSIVNRIEVLRASELLQLRGFR